MSDTNTITIDISVGHGYSPEGKKVKVINCPVNKQDGWRDILMGMQAVSVEFVK